MDIPSYISEYATRKRLVTLGNRLQDEVADMTKEELKEMVAQENDYYILLEQYQQLESIERLKQNMLELQTQYNTLSVQYEDQLRLRPELINKVSANRSICNVLVDACVRLRDTLSRNSADHAALVELYNNAEQRFKDFIQERSQAAVADQNTIKWLQAQVESKTQMSKSMENMIAKTERAKLIYKDELERMQTQKNKEARNVSELATNLQQLKLLTQEASTVSNLEDKYTSQLKTMLQLRADNADKDESIKNMQSKKPQETILVQRKMPKTQSTQERSQNRKRSLSVYEFNEYSDSSIDEDLVV